VPPNEISAPTEDLSVDVESMDSVDTVDSAESIDGSPQSGGGVLPEGDDSPVWSWNTWDGSRDSVPEDHLEAYENISSHFDRGDSIFDSIFGRDKSLTETVDYSKYMDRDEHANQIQDAVDKKIQELTDNLDSFEPHTKAVEQMKAEWAKTVEGWESQSDRTHKLMADMTNELVEANKMAQEYMYAHEYYQQETKKWADSTMEKHGDILNDNNNPQRQWYIDAIKANFDARAATGLLGAPKQAWVKALSMWKKGLDPDSAVKEALSLHPERGIPKQVTASFVGGHRIREAGSDPMRISDPKLSDREARKLAYRRASRKINSNGGN
tara:strand:- start:3460 stop:4434 length:975 start_codon:yes stop_codon:yes gene_type:complete